MKNMKINLAKSAGFCFGVRRAVDIAFKIAGSAEKVYMLGDIVHNERVIGEIEKAGIKKIIRLSKGKKRSLLIRAHGTGISTITKAKSLGYRIIDATCPMVKEIHKIAQMMDAKGYQIIIIGDKLHDEVHGIIGQLKNKTLVIGSPKDIPHKIISKIKKAAVVVQSTQTIENALKISGVLKKHIKKLKFFNTICRPTRIKQEEIKRLPLENDLMIIIGSKNSANTKRLYEISEKLNKRSFWVNAKSEIKPAWFAKVDKVGITAGASTPDATIKEIVKYIQRLK
jgi:4-hydroxy-3-methylbut-2-enyl diphosphate reductase